MTGILHQLLASTANSGALEFSNKSTTAEYDRTQGTTGKAHQQNIVAHFFVSGSVFFTMLRDPYANFVLQRALDVSTGHLYDRFIEEILKRADTTSKYTYGRHVLSYLQNMQVDSGFFEPISKMNQIEQ